MREYPRILKGFGVLMSDSTAFRSYMCVVCGFIYNEADGLPVDDAQEPRRSATMLHVRLTVRRSCREIAGRDVADEAREIV